MSIVDDVRDLARVEPEAMPIDLQTVDVDNEIAASFEIVEPLAARRGIEVSCSGAPTVARADRRGLRQVLINLLSNAMRFSASGAAISVGIDTD